MSFPPPNPSSRSLYPSFLSVQESIFLQLTWAKHGFIDGFRWDHVIGVVAGDAEIRSNIYKSLLLNTLSLISIYMFDLLLLPLVQDQLGQQKWMHRNVGSFYQVLWLFPVIGISFYLNSSWCSIIASRTFTLKHGSRRSAASEPATYTGMLTSIATSAYRIVMVFTSLVVSFALNNLPSIPYLPNVGPLLGFCFLCWLDSYYLFEFVWVARGMSLSRRIRYLEERWAYYLAFGLPSAALCTLGTGLANAAIFALVFPLYVVMAMHAQPVPFDPYNPYDSRKSSESDVIRHPSPFVPIRLPVFALVMFLNDWIVRIISVGGYGTRSTSHAHRRRMSEDSESVEEGGPRAESRSVTPGINFSSRGSTSSRINIGKRKMD